MTRRGGGRQAAGSGRPHKLPLACGLGAAACGLLLAGCGISALVPDAGMPVEQRANLYFQRAVLFPLTAGASEVAVGLAGAEADRREAALRAPGGLAAPADRTAAETAYQEGLRRALDLTDPFTRFVLASRLWLAGEVNAGRMAPADALGAVAAIQAEVERLRARRENFASASVHLRRTLWAAAPGTNLEGLQRETELYRRFRLDCPTARTWGRVESIC